MIRKIFLVFALVIIIPIQGYAVSETAPPVPSQYADYMPENTESFAEDLWSIIKSAISVIEPSLTEAGNICAALIAITLLISVVQQFSGTSGNISELVGCLLVSAMLLQTSSSLILLALDTIKEITAYGNLLIPVLAGALVGQGGIQASAALFAGTTVFSTILTWCISSLLRPLLYIYLVFAVVKCIAEDSLIDKLSDFIKWVFSWGLKIILYVFTGYMSITGVISGSADVARLKAAKLTISGMVPVVGGILSDASETVLISAGLLKSSAGIYGLLAISAILIEPFLSIGLQYLLLKVTGALCQTFGCKKIYMLIKSFSSSMGFALAMIGSVSIMLFVSVVCFMKAVS